MNTVLYHTPPSEEKNVNERQCRVDDEICSLTDMSVTCWAWIVTLAEIELIVINDATL